MTAFNGLATSWCRPGGVSMKQFYGHFAAAYGTIWFALMAVAVVSQSHVNAGAFGLYGSKTVLSVLKSSPCMKSSTPFWS